jgi:hypothetical protein
LFVGLCLGLMLNGANAGSYALTDGSTVVGEPETYGDEGVGIRKSDGNVVPLAWGRFTYEALKQLYSDASTPRQKAIVEPLIQDLPSDKPAAREITVKPIATPDRPSGHLGLLAIFTSPMGWVILLVLYGTNLFAAYEVALFRNQPIQTVCGLAAIPLFGVGSPIYYLAMPTRALLDDDSGQTTGLESDTAPIAMPAGSSRATSTPREPTAAASREVSSPSAPAPVSAQAALPAPVVFARGDFSFNRRFFETKLPGFFRVVLSEADKDMVILIKSSRGDFTGKRIPRITQTELYLQVFKEGASSEEMIPFGEVLEVQIRHKDLE